MLDEQQKERLRTLTVEVLLVLRSAYLKQHGSAVALKHWEQLQNRAQSATRTSATPEEWVNTVCKRLQIPALGSLGSSVTVDLVHYVTEHKCAPDWLALLDAELSYVMALTRLTCEKRRETMEVEG